MEHEGQSRDTRRKSTNPFEENVDDTVIPKPPGVTGQTYHRNSNADENTTVLTSQKIDSIQRQSSPKKVVATTSSHSLHKPKNKHEKDYGISLNLDVIAGKLLQDGLLLTALELHTELIEAGRELPRLRDYFSNPANFERISSPRSEIGLGLHRSSSCQTFDSLDFARSSEDGEHLADERVAVLEFELRKAQETIRSLRANLTKAAESVNNNTESVDDGGTATIDELLKPHEKRAINFLVNEYLLRHNYKLTSITFADENEDQDFEDWDDVGLNVPKPPDLIRLYRDFGHHDPEQQQQQQQQDAECQTESVADSGEECVDGGDVRDEQLTEDADKEHVTLTVDKLQYQKLYDEVESLKSSISAVQAENELLKQQQQRSVNVVNSSGAQHPRCAPAEKERYHRAQKK